MTDATTYTRLPGWGNALLAPFLFGIGNRAYLGADHVLLVRRSRYGERYRRLYFDDIQAVFYAETDDARTFNLGLLSGVVSGAGLALVFAQSPIGSAAAGVAMCTVAFCVLVLAIGANMAQGASVRCWVRTARGETHIPNVAHLRTARRFSEAIEDAVAMRQGVADRDSVEAHLSGLRAPLAGEGAAVTTPARTRRLPWLMLLAEAAYAGLTMAMPAVFPPGVWIVFTLMACAVVLVALFLDTRKRLYFPYRALITVASYYITARSLYWVLYWFLLMTEGTIIFEIAEQDLMLLGGATIIINVVLASLGFFVPASRSARPPVLPVSEPATPPTPDEDES